MLTSVIAVAVAAPLLGGCPSSVRPQLSVAAPSVWSAPFALPPRLTIPPDAPVPMAEGADTQACPTPGDTARQPDRPHAITYSSAYYTRLTIHRIGSVAMLPLFVTEVILGQKLINDSTPSSGLKTAHGIVAGGIVTVFAANTVTGGWNWLDARRDPDNRTLRNIHAAIMLVSDAGFVWTATSTPGSLRHTPPNVRQEQSRRHRAIAITSISVSTLGTAIMWIWNH